MFKEYDLQRVQSLEEKLEDLDSLSKKLLIRTVAGIRVDCLIQERFWIAL